MVAAFIVPVDFKVKMRVRAASGCSKIIKTPVDNPLVLGFIITIGRQNNGDSFFIIFTVRRRRISTCRTGIYEQK